MPGTRQNGPLEYRISPVFGGSLYNIYYDFLFERILIHTVKIRNRPIQRYTQSEGYVINVKHCFSSKFKNFYPFFGKLRKTPFLTELLELEEKYFFKHDVMSKFWATILVVKNRQVTSQNHLNTSPVFEWFRLVDWSSFLMIWIPTIQSSNHLNTESRECPNTGLV
jgi:hypothetical protein